MDDDDEALIPPTLARDWFSSSGMSIDDARRKLDELMKESTSTPRPTLAAPHGYQSVTLPGGQRMSVHHELDCIGYWCPIHYPSPHHMSMWVQHWESGKMYRVCEHGYKHPDPDDLLYRDDMDQSHDCDDCCKRQFDPKELL